MLCRSGASYWLPTGSTDGCFNFPPGCNVRGSGPGVPGPSCADGQCTDLGFTLDESFLHDPAFAGFAFSACEYCRCCSGSFPLPLTAGQPPRFAGRLAV